MYYKHYLVLNAEGGENACASAWWRVLDSPNKVSALNTDSAISEHGEVWGDEFHEGDTIEDIEDEILREMDERNGNEHYRSSTENLIDRWNNGEKLEGLEYWKIAEYFRYLSEVADAPKGKTFKDGLEFRPGEWSYLGVTNMYDPEEPGDLWVVIVRNK